MVWVAVAGIAVLAYLLGSMPTGYVVAKLLKGIDIREHGSGNPGATNVLRVVGKKAGISVLVIDLLKGVAAVSLAKALFPLSAPPAGWVDWVATLAGLLAIVGHSKSVWLGFSGGKSAATGLGVLLALSWPIGLACAGIFSLVLALSRYVSLGSMLTALAAPILMFVNGEPLPYGLLALVAGGYVIVRHKSNIDRLLAGTESKIGSKAATVESAPVE
jgi:acyl phosphate:glycerol-3-phosphate acyltransferase